MSENKETESIMGVKEGGNWRDGKGDGDGEEIESERETRCAVLGRRLTFTSPNPQRLFVGRVWRESDWKEGGCAGVTNAK